MRRPGHDYEKENFKSDIESLLIAAQNNVRRTKYIKAKIEET